MQLSFRFQSNPINSYKQWTNIKVNIQIIKEHLHMKTSAYTYKQMWEKLTEKQRLCN